MNRRGYGGFRGANPTSRSDIPRLFSKGDLRDVLANQEKKAYDEIDGADSNYLLNISSEDYADYLEQNFGVECLRLLEDQITVDQQETQVDVRYDPNRWIDDKSRPFYVPAVALTFMVPFTGDPELFHYSPGILLSSPHGAVEGMELYMSYTLTDHDASSVRQNFDNDLTVIKNHLAQSEGLVRNFNQELRPKLVRRIEMRRQKLLNDQGMVAALGFPLRQRADAPRTYAVPDVRRKPEIKRPAGALTPFKPEPTLGMETYENILRIIMNMALVLERSPNDFRNMGEEALRQQFLVQLNGQYEGQATGETFNHTGKTDILIRAEGANVFIAECKFWKGEKVFLATIDQLLSYVTWRDTKTAILVFNKNRDFTTVLSAIQNAAPRHSNFKRQVSYNSESGFRYIFHHPNDVNREVIVTVLAFDVPC